MCLTLTKHYILIADMPPLVQGNEYRMTGFTLETNEVLLADVTSPVARFEHRIPKDWCRFFVEKTEGLDVREYRPPPDDAFRGIAKSTVVGYYEGQKTNLTCWASCLANVLCTVENKFIDERNVVELLCAERSTGGPNHEEYVTAIEKVLRLTESKYRCCIIEAGILRNWPELLKRLEQGIPVICSVNKRTHVVVILGYTTAKPYWIMYFEPTSGRFRKISLNRFLAEQTPDWAYSFDV